MLQEVINELAKVTQDELEQETNELKDEFDGLENHYIFSPSITKQRTINGKTYIVRSYFNGKKDFKKIICEHAFKRSLAEKGEN